ncbi:sodium-dependent transporter bedraggled [Leptopilina heterotoma]|uniref:sodium-dependent transporter bedraggled n=1 Tax=Leptopilina heterotoma TaxID=63436 RepID=UPI001CA914E3|nr:sodium-dependent transporter bedraggled [Leptopilina heterotoma]XP_043483924.1 sodium-dependent transporter bedraggled [Leptopilina heterotoma]
MQSNTTEDENNGDDKFLGKWPYRCNSAFACLGCTIGVFNINRFAINCTQYGVNFIIQFLIMSLIFGIPLFIFQICLGQKYKRGILHLWKISPIFQGIGVALLLVQIYIGIYNIVGVSWLLVYFRESFISNNETYRWADDFILDRSHLNVGRNTTTTKMTELPLTFFNHAFLSQKDMNQQNFSTTLIRFQIAFNLAVMWTVVFFSLFKGLRSYGKVISYYVLTLLACNLLFGVKVLNLIPQDPFNKMYSTHVWSEFFLNEKSWVAAASEAFFTWGLLSVAAMQTAVHNKDKNFVKRDILFVVTFTMLLLFLNGFIANTCVKILNVNGYNFIKNESENVHMLVYNPNYASTTNVNNIPHTSFPHENIFITNAKSYQIIKEYNNDILRYSTELVPLAISLLGSKVFTAFWTILFYLGQILIGLVQQLAIWNCVMLNISSINGETNKRSKIRLVFLSCLCGFCLGVPMTTNLGGHVIYYLENIIGKSWWVIILYLIQFGVVFLVRRVPYNVIQTTETILSPSNCVQQFVDPMLSFLWNIPLPTALTVLSIIIFKMNGLGEYYLNQKIGKSYWNIWTSQIGIIIQLAPLLIIPMVAVVQVCRYLCSGPTKISKRIQLLCRPPLEVDCTQNVQDCDSEEITDIRENIDHQSITDLIVEDSPPKYTPPPSYSTATGERMMRFLRRSFRKSIRSIGNILKDGNESNTKPTLIPSELENKM